MASYNYTNEIERERMSKIERMLDYCTENLNPDDPRPAEPERLDVLRQIAMTRKGPSGIRSLYNGWADRYDQTMTIYDYKAPQIAAEILWTKLRLGPEARILDLGCGTGLSGQALQNVGFTTIDGIDISENMAEEAKRKLCYTKTWLLNITSNVPLTFARYLYDCLLLCTSLIPAHISPKSLPHLSRLLQNSGYLVIVGPTVAFMSDCSKMFEENVLMAHFSKLENAGIKLIERDQVPNFRTGEYCEYFIFQKQ